MKKPGKEMTLLQPKDITTSDVDKNSTLKKNYY